MTGLHRVRFRRGDLELEIESPDKSFIDEKIAELIGNNDAHPRPQQAPQQRRQKGKGGKRPSASADNESEGNDTQLDVARLVGRIHDDDEFAAAEEHVLNKTPQFPRILLCFYFADKLADGADLSTGQVEQLTDSLGARIKNNNVATVLGNFRKYVTADAVRKRGAKVRYRINRQGKEAFKRLLLGEKLK